MQPTANIQVIISSDIIPGRFVIIDARNGHTIDNAQGWGFKSASKAEAYAEVQGWTIINSSKVQSNNLF